MQYFAYCQEKSAMNFTFIKDTMKLFAERLRNSREFAGMNQKELSEILGISLRTLVTYEKNPTNLTIKNMKNIARCCNVDEVWLLTGMGKMSASSQTESTSINLFLDAPRADRIIHQLATLERTDPAKYNKVEGYIDAQIDNPPQKNAAAEIRDVIKKTGT